MILHMTLLSVQTILVVINTLPNRIINSFYYKLQIVLVVVDTCVELAILYICWTMGASAQLRRFKCTLVQYENGQVDIKF